MPHSPDYKLGYGNGYAAGRKRALPLTDGKRDAIKKETKDPTIANRITRIGDGGHVGWSLYIEDYDRAVMAMAEVIYFKVVTSGDAPANCAEAALAAIGINKPTT